jgi:outer membrane protein assembly factor BamB
MRSTTRWFLLIGVYVLAGAEWPRFRGPNGTGISDEPAIALPDAVALDRNLVWQQKVQKGASSPVSDGQRILLTGYEGSRRSAMCFDASTGQLKWTRSVERVRTEAFHAMHGPATPTPVLANGRVIALFADFGLIAYDLEGRELWRRPLGPIPSVQGYAASPIVTGGLVIIVVDTPELSYVAAFEESTGREVWRTERPNGVLGGYATPTIWKEQVIVAGARELTGYRAATGERFWWGPGITSYPIAPPFVDGDSVYTMEPAGVGWPPFEEPLGRFDQDGDGRVSVAESAGDASWQGSLRGIDLNAGNGDGFVTREEYAKGTSGEEGGLYRIRLDGAKGQIGGDQIQWRVSKSVPAYSGALLYQGILYTVRRGILTTIDPETGARIGEARLPDALGEYYAAPVAGDGKIYLASHEGVVTVVRAGRDWRVLSTANLGAPIIATPALAGGKVFIRTESTLYAFSVARQQQTCPAADSALVITHATLVEGRTLAADREIVISGGRVVASGRSGRLRRPAGSRVIDAKGDTLIPGLIDAHVHLYELGGPSPREMYTAPRENSFPITGRQLLRSGVTTARVHLFDSVNGPALKRDAAADCYPSPRLQIGGPGMTGGQPSMAGSYFTGYTDLDDARAKLSAMKAAGADWVALHGLDRFAGKDLEAIAGEARRVGLRIMAEGDPASRASRALDIGADSIEYLDRGDGGGYSAELIERLKKSNAYLVPPVGYFNRIVEMRRDPALADSPLLTEFMPAAVASGVRDRLREWLGKPNPMEQVIGRVNERFLQLTRAGVKIAAGTDCGSPGNFQVDAIWWELETRRRLGLTPLQALEAATGAGAGLLKADDIGHLRPGARGDFVLYRGAIDAGPLDVGRVRTVAKGGVLFVDEGKWTGR